MKSNFLFITAVLAVGILLLPILFVHGQPIAQDSCGIIVEFREKYGPVVHDTGTVVMVRDNCWVITHRDGCTTWYPIVNYAISRITKLKQEEAK